MLRPTSSFPSDRHVPLRRLGAALAALVAAAMFVVACSTEPAAAGIPDAADAADAGVALDAVAPPVEAATDAPSLPDASSDAGPVFPQAVSKGGAVIAAPKLQTITFAGDPSVDLLESFGQKLQASTYFAAIGKEYGVGPLQALAPVRLSEALPATVDDAAIVTLLKAQIASGALPAADTSTLYMIYFPLGVTISTFSGQSCVSFGGYHMEAVVNGIPIGYAVIPRCQPTSGQVGSVVGLTTAASHELFEWATDPLPFSAPAYNSIDDDHAGWTRFFGGELGDLCSDDHERWVTPTDLGFVVQRMWSNDAARAGHDPCAPNAGELFFTSIPQSLTSIAVSYAQYDLVTRGLELKVGETRTIDVRVHADGAVGPLEISAVNLNVLARGTDGLPDFELTLDRKTAMPGEIVKLTLRALRLTNDGWDIDHGFVLFTKRTSTSATTKWPTVAVVR